MNKPPSNKVSILFCLKMLACITTIPIFCLQLFCLLRWTSTCAWYVAVGLLRTACCCVTAVMTVITSSVWSLPSTTFPKATGDVPSAWLRWAADPPPPGSSVLAEELIIGSKSIMICLITTNIIQVFKLNIIFFTGMWQTSCRFWLWAGEQELHPPIFWRHGRFLQVWLFQHASSCEFASLVNWYTSDFHSTKKWDTYIDNISINK